MVVDEMVVDGEIEIKYDLTNLSSLFIKRRKEGILGSYILHCHPIWNCYW